MGLIYEPNSLIERRMEYERKWREEVEREAARKREKLRRLQPSPRRHEASSPTPSSGVEKREAQMTEESQQNATAKGGPAERRAFEEVNHLLALTREEDERGLVLSVAAYMEDILGRLLLAYLRPVKSARMLVEGFDAPLGSLSARIRAAHALGLISATQLRDLNITRKIRNEFAHNWKGCSFRTQNVKDMIAALEPSRLNPPGEEPASERHKFQGCITAVLIELTVVLERMNKQVRPLPTVALHVGPPISLDEEP